MTKGTKLIPQSRVFVGPEEVVTTFEVEHPATLGSRIGGWAPQDATIIKGCPRRYALETCESLQMGTLPYYRKQGDPADDEREYASIPNATYANPDQVGT